MILAIPIKNQYEQYCNAAALSEMGVITVNQVWPSFSNTVQNCLMTHPLSNWKKLQKLMSWLSFSSGLHLSDKAAVIRQRYFKPEFDIKKVIQQETLWVHTQSGICCYEMDAAIYRS